MQLNKSSDEHNLRFHSLLHLDWTHLNVALKHISAIIQKSICSTLLLLCQENNFCFNTKIKYTDDCLCTSSVWVKTYIFDLGLGKQSVTFQHYGFHFWRVRGWGCGIVPRVWVTSHGPKRKKNRNLKKKNIIQSVGITVYIHRSTGLRKSQGAFDTKDTLKFFRRMGWGVGGTSTVWKRSKCDSLNRFSYIHNALTAKNAYVSFHETVSILLLLSLF